ncbi:phosphodiester glycosidase family protein [Acinetobacter haemolyticus]|uniref:phosphodiester glycosidase family protein n=1 Tax=Acinetobacter haemolyticus TaxID=29430 RepID=UPI002DB87A74|nr:phosphodiester glycosidase family protein [Acinetobacter haemolyticus]MEB6677568.1 phosphodiester glycosidase family protein [Acinetobacter haemolyticus]
MRTGFLILLTLLAMPNAFAMQHHVYQFERVNYSVVEVQDLNVLKLYLKSPKTNRYYHKFSNIQSELQACERLDFAMNAGMYHSDFQPVGLYIEDGNEVVALNEDRSFGNFFMQPNGMLAWNQTQAIIKTTSEYKQHSFDAIYATQSGPMLVYDGKINPKFLPDSNSLKVRNGVGIKDSTLYFVISQQRVSFYQFAQFFKQQLSVEDALYLDGSISSFYSAKTKQHDRLMNLGPIVAGVKRDECR